ncbi:hypothetical protein BDQ12DRAFT_693638 [Crucibulum laeve]|uniref:Uncharacterized protein n=1 Tax=Crucibulum laeve TaxID=68775 RepID=A0A5C3LGI7_9AGAR|nr:hypothetical protein BDQ12DRAFT_693638 [Crucibulum laeve]
MISITRYTNTPDYISMFLSSMYAARLILVPVPAILSLNLHSFSPIAVNQIYSLQSDTHDHSWREKRVGFIAFGISDGAGIYESRLRLND